MSTQWAVVTGNPVDGLFFYGPFDSLDTAREWAAREHEGQDWWITELLEPRSEGSDECNHEPAQKVGEIICAKCGKVLR